MMKIVTSSRTSQYRQGHKCKKLGFLTSEQLTEHVDGTAETHETEGGWCKMSHTVWTTPGVTLPTAC